MEQPRQPPLLSERFADYLAHWRALKGEGRAATLADFLDKPIPGSQPWMTIVDVEGALPVRLFGTALVSFYGADYTGAPFHEIIAPEGINELRRVHVQMAETLCGSLTVNICRTSTGRTAELAALGLPFIRGAAVSVSWLVEPAVRLGLGETGTPVRRAVALDWIDLGHGVPK